MIRQRGFSLIELLIVVAIILIIAAIGVPNFLRARLSANEAAAVAAVRVVNSAEVTYANNYPLAGYADLPTLGGPSPCTAIVTQACLIDNSLATATVSPGKSGYIYSMAASQTNYVIASQPATPSLTGVRTFCSTNDAVIRFAAAGGAVASVPACQALPGLQ